MCLYPVNDIRERITPTRAEKVVARIFGGFLWETEYLIHDRDPLFTRAFGGILESRG